jgi:4-carboxymuconolactone decarboxylase
MTHDNPSLEARSTTTNEPPRFNGPSEEKMTEEQRQIRQEILASRPGTGLSGPFGPWLATPQIARPAQALGRACRYGTSLSPRESELVILLTAAKTRSNTEFQIHVGEALNAGLSVEIIQAIPRDESFSLASVKETLCPLLENERERAIVLFTAELLDTFKVSDETYNFAKMNLGGEDSVLVEITSIAGYYTFVSYTLNVFRISA